VSSPDGRYIIGYASEQKVWQAADGTGRQVTIQLEPEFPDQESRDYRRQHSVNYPPVNGRVCGSPPWLAARSGRVRTVDCAPTLDTALGDVDSRVLVGVGNDPARPADEGGLLGPVALVSMPHRLHVCDVYAGSTCTSATPDRCALYSRKQPSWANAQECTAARWGLRSRTLARMPVNCSTAIPRAVRGTGPHGPF
jgi:hypothetical protein